MYIYYMDIDKNITFEHSYKNLLLWFGVTYLIFGPLLKFLRNFNSYPEILSNFFYLDNVYLAASFSSITSFFLYLFLAYLAFYYCFPKKKILLLIAIIGALLIPIAYRFLLDQKVFLWLFGYTNYRPDITYTFYFSDNTYFAVYYIPSGILYYFYRRNKALQEARLEAERQRAKAELTHLRSQVNPHFLFNSLNNIYALAYEKSDKILGAIEGLSELLRYSLYEKAEFVPFEKEWSKIMKLIHIEQMRLIAPTDFKIDITQAALDTMIPPVILLPFIENIFKHGKVQDEQNPPQIKADVIEDQLIITIQNKISSSQQKDSQSGIGLENIQKRLQYAYGNEATFEVSQKDDTFNVKLAMPSL